MENTCHLDTGYPLSFLEIYFILTFLNNHLLSISYCSKLWTDALGKSKGSQTNKFVKYQGLDTLKYSPANTHRSISTPWLWAMYAVFPKTIWSGTPLFLWLVGWLFHWLAGWFWEMGEGREEKRREEGRGEVEEAEEKGKGGGWQQRATETLGEESLCSRRCRCNDGHGKVEKSFSIINTVILNKGWAALWQGN